MEIGTFADILKQHGVYHGAGVPCSYFTPLVNHMTVDPDLDYLSATEPVPPLEVLGPMWKTADARHLERGDGQTPAETEARASAR